MALPPTTTVFAARLDPSAELDFVVDLTGDMLEEGEQIDTYSLVVTPEAAALGLTIATTGDRAHASINGDTAVRMWLTIDPELQTDPAFLDDGTLLGIEITVVTNSIPARTHQETIAVRVAQL